MKIIIKLSFFLLLTLTISCSDFEDINIHPTAASADQVQVEYFINNSIVSAQIDPHVAERSFVLYWKYAGHQDSTNTLTVGNYNDGRSGDYFSYMSEWINHAYTTIEVDKQ